MWEPLVRDTPSYSAAGHRIPGERTNLTRPNDQVSAAAAHDDTGRRRLQTFVGPTHFFPYCTQRPRAASTQSGGCYVT